MGWIKVDRCIMDHELWEDKPFSKGQAWIDLILLANYKDKKQMYKGDVVVSKRGEVGRSILWLSNRWGWSRHKTRDFLNFLETQGMIVVDATTSRTTITVENYSKYQDAPTTKGQQKDNERTTGGHNQEGKKERINNIVSQSVNNKYNITRARVREEDMDRLTDYYADVDELLNRVDAKIKARRVQTPIFNMYSYVVNAAEDMQWPTVAEKQASQAKRKQHIEKLEEEDRKEIERLNALAREKFRREI